MLRRGEFYTRARGRWWGEEGMLHGALDCVNCSNSFSKLRRFREWGRLWLQWLYHYHNSDGGHSSSLGLPFVFVLWKCADFVAFDGFCFGGYRIMVIYFYFSIYRSTMFRLLFVIALPSLLDESFGWKSILVLCSLLLLRHGTHQLAHSWWNRKPRRWCLT